MCIKFEVTVPTVETFLFLYTLRQGAITILLWTVLRSLFCLLFFMVAILEVLIKRQLPFGPILVHTANPIAASSILLVYFYYQAMTMIEVFLLISNSQLAAGIRKESARVLVTFLVTRLITWMGEILFLVLLCVAHKLLIGWYLGFLFFVVLELYGFIVVYSYYTILWDLADACQPCKDEE